MTVMELDSVDDLQSDVYDSINQQYASANYTKTLMSFVDVLETRHASMFAESKNPVGESWPPLAQSTIDRKGHDTILVESDRLRSSLVGSESDSIRDIFQEENTAGLVFGTRIPYASFHQHGTARIPQREHVGMNDETLQQLVDNVADFTVDVIREG